MPTQLIAYLAGALMLLGIGGYGGYQVTAWAKDETINTIKLADATAQKQAADLSAANQRNADLLDKDRAVKDAAAQQHLQDLANLIPTQVTHYVSNKVPCISVGFVRVLDAAVIGTDPANLPLASGQSNDTCAAIDNTTLAASIARNYITSGQNAQQLNDLIDNVTAIHDQVVGGQAQAKPSWWGRNFGK